MRSALIAAVLLVMVVATGASADDRNRDCSKLKKWNYDKEYKRGDTVWYNAGGNDGAEYQCTKDKCQKAEPTLSSGRDSWKSLGTCAKRPSGVSADANVLGGAVSRLEEEVEVGRLTSVCGDPKGT